MTFLICDGLFWLVVLLRILVAFYVPCWFTFVLVYRCGGLLVCVAVCDFCYAVICGWLCAGVLLRGLCSLWIWCFWQVCCVCLWVAILVWCWFSVCVSCYLVRVGGLPVFVVG